MLTNAFVVEQIQPILAILGPTAKEGIQDWVTQIVDACGWMQPQKFEEVRREIVRTWRNNWRPKPSEFASVYNRLAKDRGWGQKDVQKCHGCAGIGLIQAWFRRISEDGVELAPIEAAKPCPMCRPEHRNSELKPGLVEISRDEYDQLRGKKCFSTLLAEALSRAKPVQTPVNTTS